jgi:hypothetical protein
MDYEQLEDSLVERLADQFFDALPLPETQIGFTINDKPRVFITYDASDYTETENLNMIVQEDRIKVGFELTARTRRGEQGVFSMFKIVKTKILGYKLPGCDKLQLLSFTPLMGSGPNKWMYYAQFITISHIAESGEEEDLPVLTQITVDSE